jgi:ABC-type dipeptide/oligopeptide/nickel transport system ATPase component
MDLLREINKSQGTTFIVVTHDLAVARQTNRVLVMEDGKITREDLIGSPIEEDLKMWRHSGLGRRIVDGDHDGELTELELEDEWVESVRSLLKTTNES